jgi:SNF2 family DNA or RNA helicase
MIETPADIYLLNYDGLMVYMTRFKEGKAGKSQRQPAAKLVRDFCARFKSVIYDEIHELGTHNALTFRLARFVSKQTPLRLGLSGTPMGRDPVKLWSEFYVVDLGETLGDTLGMFRAAFYDAKENFWGGTDYTFRRDMRRTLNRMIQHRSIRYEESEMNDLPPLSRNVIRVSFPEEPRAYYERVLEELRASRGGLQERTNAYVRMRQCCSGFLTLRGEDDEKAEIRFYTNPKLEALETHIKSLPENEKILVFHEYVFTGTLICEMLDKIKVGWARVGGKAKNPIQQQKKFYTNPKCRVFVINNSSGGAKGINPQKVCRRALFFESPSDPSRRRQAEKRVYRTGQEHHTFITDIIVAKSIDEQIQFALRSGQDVFNAVIEGREDVFSLEGVLRPARRQLRHRRP